MTSANHHAEQRLLHDLQEVLTSPVLDTAAHPLEENLFEWHVNITSNNCGQLNGIVFHLILEFPKKYPTEPPRVILCTPMPHANVFPDTPVAAGGSGMWKICLDMLNTGDFTSAEQKAVEFTGWSSSYTVHTLLVQLNAFLLDTKLHTAVHKVGFDEARALATNFKCPRCSHCPSAQWPAVVRSTSTSTSTPSNKSFRVIKFTAIQLSETRLPRSHPVVAPTCATPTAAAATSTLVVAPAAPVVAITTKTKKPSTTATKQTTQVAKPKAEVVKAVSQEDEWHTVVYRHKKVKRTTTADKTPKPKHIKPTSKVVIPATKKKTVSTVAQPIVITDEMIAKEMSIPGLVTQTLLPQAAKLLTKQSMEKARKRLTAKKTTVQPSPPKQPQQPTQQQPVKSSNSAAATTTVHNQVPHTTTTELDSVVFTDDGRVLLKESEVVSMGRLFGNIPYDVTLYILSMLRPSDLASMSRTCKAMAAICSDGFLWKLLFAQAHPSCNLSVDSMRDWKRLFACETDQVLEELCCFHTKLSFMDDVLGVPLSYTVNPRTNCVDYIYSTMDVLSKTAFIEGNVRQTVFKEKFTDWLPLYITADHFKRGLPYIQKVLTKLADSGAHHFDPLMALDSIPRLMNTMVVLLSDNGVHASDVCLNGLCALHRLLLALMEKFPQLEAEVERRLMAFASSEANRHKDVTFSMGDFLPLLSLTKTQPLSWAAMGPKIITESFTRHVIWGCKAHPELAQNLTEGTGADTDRLNKTFESSKVSLKLMLFHVAFWRTFTASAGSLDAIKDNYDIMFGRPPRHTRNTFRDTVKKILEVSSWPQFFAMAGFQCPSPAALTDWLKRSVVSSLKKGYHRANMDFSRVQASGVSKILLKGDSFTAAPTMKECILEEVWSYPATTLFLDASCIACDSTGTMHSIADYCHISPMTGMTHSGDVMNPEKHQGTHRIQLKLRELPEHITKLYFTISAWTTLLTEIQQPHIRFTDVDTGMELCRYYLEDKPTGTNTAVIMCKLTKSATTGCWTVTPIGQLCMGRASDYTPILKELANL